MQREDWAGVFVSDSRKVVFVHIQKTGGITVDRLLNERIPDLRLVGTRHGFASLGMDELDDWDEYFKFAFVRNPWDRLVSWYSMVTTMPKDGNELWRYVHDNSSTFEEFIYNCTDEVEIKDGVHYSFAYNQLDYVTDDHGNLLVDFIGRLENFDNDIQERYRVLRLRVRKPEKTRGSLRLWLRQERDYGPCRLPEPTSEDPPLPGKLTDHTAGGDHPGTLYVREDARPSAEGARGRGATQRWGPSHQATRGSPGEQGSVRAAVDRCQQLRLPDAYGIGRREQPRGALYSHVPSHRRGRRGLGAR